MNIFFVLMKTQLEQYEQHMPFPLSYFYCETFKQCHTRKSQYSILITVNLENVQYLLKSLNCMNQVHFVQYSDTHMFWLPTTSHMTNTAG